MGEVAGAGISFVTRLSIPSSVIPGLDPGIRRIGMPVKR